jgi:tetratricopeptide (TPR) repeat protein
VTVNSETENLRSEHTGDFLRLAQLWEKRTHLSWMFAAVNAPDYRDAIIRRLDARYKTQRIELSVQTTAHSLEQAMLQARNAHHQRLHIVCADGFIPARDWWPVLNTMRERLASAFPHTVIWWLPDACITDIAQQAADFWNWRELVCNFQLNAPTRTPHEHERVQFDGVQGFEKASLEKRLKEINAYLADPDHQDNSANAHLWLEASRAHRRLGEMNLAMTEADKAKQLFQHSKDALNASFASGQIADILQARGQLDEALRIRVEEQMPVYEKLGEVRSIAITKGKIADILQARGQLDEALRIRREEELPVYEKLGEVREIAITKGRIADILQARGQLDEALRIRREEELPVYEKLGEVRSIAITKGKIADILQTRGELDEALRVYQEEMLPTFLSLGEIGITAVIYGRIADILQARGQLDEALRIRREEELPVYEKLGEVRAIAITKGKIADILQARGQLDEALRIRVEEQMPVYEKLGEVREIAITKGKIANILQARGELDEALRIRREEELPVYEKLGDARALLVGRTNLAIGYWQRNKAGDRTEAHRLLCLALKAAQAMRLAEAQQIEGALADFGLICSR